MLNDNNNNKKKKEKKKKKILLYKRASIEFSRMKYIRLYQKIFITKAIE
jgi:hypothetical protein